jgi:hypothetical protein
LETESNPNPVPDPIPDSDPDSDPDSVVFPISGSPTSVSGNPISQSNRDILCDFNSDSGSDRKEQEDILLHFNSQSSDDEDLEDAKTGTEDGELNSSAHAAGMSRQPGERYTEFDFDFLDERWLEITDNSEGDDQISSSSGSTDQ